LYIVVSFDCGAKLRRLSGHGKRVGVAALKSDETTILRINYFFFGMKNCV